MQIRLLSDDVHIDVARVTLLSRDNPSAAPALIGTGTVRDNVISDGPSLQAGRVILQLEDCVVTRKHTGVRHHILGFAVSALVEAGHLAEGVGEIHLGPLVLVQIKALNADGTPARDRPSVGIALLPATIQAPANEDGFLETLVPPGQYSVFVAEQPPIRERIDVKQAVEEMQVELCRRKNAGES